jgi:HAD superfamily hydrolase (TIGR01509 family)
MKLDVKAVIYDLDGVLVDSLEANVAYYNRLLEYFGRPPLGGEHLEVIQTRTSPEVIGVLFPDAVQAEEAQALEKRLSNDEIIPLIRLEPYVRETLEGLQKRYRLAVATNRGKSLPLVLEFHHLGRYFDLTVSSAQVQRPKPHPAYLDMILREFSLAPHQAVYVGDAEVDAQLAGAVGVPFLSYKNPRLKARAYLQEHRDIWDLLGS